MTFDFVHGLTTYETAADDARQDRELGDFRGRARLMAEQGDAILEIGPGYAPLFRKSEGHNVSIIDHLDTQGLIAKYRAMGVEVSQIEDVDYVYRGESIPDLVGSKKFKLVYASHVVEHSTDLIRFLTGCSEVLEDEGLIVLLVPDKRYCFDYFQPLTDTAKVVADYARRATRHSLESLYREEMQIVASYAGSHAIAWWQGEVSDAHLKHVDPAARLQNALAGENSPEYIDAHEYYFVPASFHLIVEEANLLGLLPLRVSLLSRARGCEFMAVLTKADLRCRPVDQFLALKKDLAVRAVAEQMEAFEKLEPARSRHAIAS